MFRGPFLVYSGFIPRSKIKTGGSNLYSCAESQHQDRRVASRQTPYFLQRQKSMQKGLLLRRALLSPVVGVLFSYKVDEHMSAAWHRKPIPAFLNPLNGRAFIFRMACHDNIRCLLFIV